MDKNIEDIDLDNKINSSLALTILVIFITANINISIITELIQIIIIYEQLSFKFVL